MSLQSGSEGGVASLFAARLTVSGASEVGETLSAIAWSPGGRRVAAGSLGGELILCGAGGRDAVRADTRSPVLALAWSSEADMMAAACEDGAVWLWGAGDEPVRVALGTTAEDMAWGAGGLAVALGDAVVVMHGGGEGRVDVEVPPGAAMVVAWTSPGPGAALLLGGLGGLREVLLHGAGGESWPSAAVVALAVDPSSGVVAAGTLGGEVLIGRESKRMRVGRDAVSSLSWSRRRSLMATVADGALAVRTMQADGTMDGPHRLAGHDDWVTDAAFGPVGTLLASVGADGRLVLWDPGETSDPLERVDLGAPLTTLGWSPDGRAVAVGGQDGVLTVVNCSQLAPA